MSRHGPKAPPAKEPGPMPKELETLVKSSGSATATMEPPPDMADDYTPPGADSEVDRLRRELAEKEKALDDLRADIAKRDSIEQPLADSGPGTYSVVCRHSPARLKKWQGEADNEADAWAKYTQAAMKMAYNPKDLHQRAVKLFEEYLNVGRREGFDRTITKVK